MSIKKHLLTKILIVCELYQISTTCLIESKVLFIPHNNYINLQGEQKNEKTDNKIKKE